MFFSPVESSAESCQCPCCANPSIPHHPLNTMTSNSGFVCTHRDKGKGLKTYSRHIQPTWYVDFPWISVCSSTLKIYCSICRDAKSRGLVTFSRNYKPAFIEDGFQNLKKARERFRDHESSGVHAEAVMKLGAVKSSSSSVGALLSTQLENQQKHHRVMLMKLLGALKYLTRQGLPLRGHHEDNDTLDGNLYQLLLFQSEDCLGMESWVHQREYISPEITNELIVMMGQFVLRSLLSDIRTALWFSILADEATDISHHEQMSLSIRWVDEGYTIHEDVLGLFQLPDTRAASIFSAIKDILIRCTLPIVQCRGQAFDGASNMSGAHNGVQALVKRENSKALYVHCLAHSLNLCLKDVTNACVLIRNAMNFIFTLVQLIRFSPKRLSLFDSIRKNITVNTGENTPSLRMVCPTRWTIRHTSISSILQNYSVLQTALEEIQLGHDDYAAKASGLLAQMRCFDIYFALKLAYLVFSAAEQLSINLQSVDLTVQEALNGARLLRTHLQTLRNEGHFDRFYDSVCQESSTLTDDAFLPRQRRAPRRYDEGAQPHHFDSPKARYRHAYYEVLDLAIGEIERRFDHNDLKTVKQIEVLLVNAGNGVLTHSIDPELQSYLKDDFDLDRLRTQLSLVKDMVHNAEVRVTSVTNVRTISNAMNTSCVYKKMLNEIDKLLKLYYTFPVTTATSERSFSSLRRLKTFLRTTMTECRLNNLFLLYVHKSVPLNLTCIAKDFVAVNSRRMKYFGKFYWSILPQIAAIVLQFS